MRTYENTAPTIRLEHLVIPAEPVPLVGNRKRWQILQEIMVGQSHNKYDDVTLVHQVKSNNSR